MRVGLGLLKVAIGNGVVSEKVAGAKKFFLFDVVVRESLMIIGESAREVTRIDEGKSLALFDAVPGTDFHFDDATACGREHVHDARGVRIDVGGKIEVIGNWDGLDGQSLDAFGIGCDVIGRYGIGARRGGSIGVATARKKRNQARGEQEQEQRLCGRS
ncbi:MAG: hypothetical protein WA737_09110 [Candidatus Acidiferrales bacterium]